MFFTISKLTELSNFKLSQVSQKLLPLNFLSKVNPCCEISNFRHPSNCSEKLSNHAPEQSASSLSHYLPTPAQLGSSEPGPIIAKTWPKFAASQFLLIRASARNTAKSRPEGALLDLALVFGPESEFSESSSSSSGRIRLINFRV